MLDGYSRNYPSEEEDATNYARVKREEAKFRKSYISFQRIVSAFANLPAPVPTAIQRCATELFFMEEFAKPLTEGDRHVLYAKSYFYLNKDELLERFNAAVSRALEPLDSARAFIADDGPFSVPLISAMADPLQAIERLYDKLSSQEVFNLFRQLSDTLRTNRYTACGISPITGWLDRNIPTPTDSKLSPLQAVDAYLAGTSFQALLKTEVPLRMGLEQRLSHTWVLAPSGGGKTTLLENLVLYYLRSPEKPGLVIFDPHSSLVEKVKRADLGLDDRLVLIDPRDRQPAAINIFATNRERHSHYDEAMREQLAERVIETFDYFFSALDVDLSGKQGVFTRYLLRFLMSFPETLGRNATLADMLAVLAEPGARNPQLPEPYASAVMKLKDEVLGKFMREDFLSKSFSQTHDQLRYRVQGIMENTALRRIFAAEETRIDFFSELNKGSVILIDTAQDYLGKNASLFAGAMISLILQAVHERAAIEERDRKPAFIIIDEAGGIFSNNIDGLLTDARKFKVGMVLANQAVEQAASSALRASLNGVACKFVGPDDGAARFTAANMRTTREFIVGQPEYHFAAHVRGMTKSVSIRARPREFERIAQRSDADYEALLERNRQRVSLTVPESVVYPEAEPFYAHAAEHPEDDILPE